MDHIPQKRRAIPGIQSRYCNVIYPYILRHKAFYSDVRMLEINNEQKQKMAAEEGKLHSILQYLRLPKIMHVESMTGRCILSDCRVHYCCYYPSNCHSRIIQVTESGCFACELFLEISQLKFSSTLSPLLINLWIPDSQGALMPSVIWRMNLTGGKYYHISTTILTVELDIQMSKQIALLKPIRFRRNYIPSWALCAPVCTPSVLPT
jgi:hypothetical protein